MSTTLTRRAFARFLTRGAIAAAITPATDLVCPTGLADGSIPAGHAGIAAIGLGAFHAVDADLMADAILAANRPLEIAFLSHSFNLNDPFGMPSRVLQRVARRLKSKLTVTVYLDDGPNRKFHDAGVIRYGPSFRPDLTMARFWSLLGQPRPSREAATVQSQFKVQRVLPLRTFVGQWAPVLRQLDWCVVLQLEDGCRNVKDYTNALARIRGEFNHAAIRFRRNGSPRIAGLPFESHGLSGSGLLRGDVLTNDGSPTSAARFAQVIRPLVRGGVHCLWWEAAYNGGPRTSPPHLRGALRPFTGTPDPQAKQRELINLLKVS